MSERIEEIKKRLIELEKLHEPLYNEECGLRREMDELSTTLAEEVIKDITWELSYDPISYSSSGVVLTSEIQEEREKANDKLWKLSGEHYHPFDISDTVYITMDDGELRMHFIALKDFKSYIKTHPLKIDYTRFKENLDNFKNDIKNLEEMMSVFLEDMELSFTKNDKRYFTVKIRYELTGVVWDVLVQNGYKSSFVLRDNPNHLITEFGTEPAFFIEDPNEDFIRLGSLLWMIWHPSIDKMDLGRFIDAGDPYTLASLIEKLEILNLAIGVSSLEE